MMDTDNGQTSKFDMLVGKYYELSTELEERIRIVNFELTICELMWEDWTLPLKLGDPFQCIETIPILIVDAYIVIESIRFIWGRLSFLMDAHLPGYLVSLVLSFVEPLSIDSSKFSNVIYS